VSAQIPDAEHKLKGTRPTRAADHGADIPGGRPAYPKGISPQAKRVFKRLVRLLEQRRALTHGDGELLRLYSLLYTRHETALAKLTEEGEIKTYFRLNSNGESVPQEKPNLWLKVAETCERNMVACLDRMGLTPNARAKVKQVGDKPKPAATPEEEYFGNIGKPAQAAPTLDDFDDIETEGLPQ
jgi:P27 family predicted phage terminase small subunit